MEKFWKRKMSLLAVLILAVAMLFTGCDDDEYYDVSGEEYYDGDASDSSNSSDSNSSAAQQSNRKNTGDTWSVFVYLCGTDLESDSETGGAASYNLYEMMYADLSDKVNLVVQTGGTKAWMSEEFDLDMDVDVKKLQRWQLTDNDITLVDEKSLASMGRTETLSDFLSWGTSNYPADKYMVIFWDHGGGSGAGVAYDELFEGEFLTIDEIAEGLRDSGATYELVGFDACLMSTLETAAAVSPYANFLVASEETEPGAGWDYSTWLDYLSKDSSITGDILGIEICDSYMNKCKEYDTDSMATLAVTDLSKIPELVAAFDKMASQMKGYSNDVQSMKVIKGAINKAESYGYVGGSDYSCNLVDLGDLTLCAQNVLSGTAEDVLNCIIAADVYHIGGAGRQKGNGLAVYMPITVDKEQLNIYARNSAISAEYIRFIEGITGWKAPSDTVIHAPMISEDNTSQTTEEDSEVQTVIEVEETDLSQAEEATVLDSSDYTVDFDLDVTDDGYAMLYINEGADIISEAKCDLFYYDEEYDEILYLGSDYDVITNDDWTEISDNFRNVWVFMEDNLCEMIAIDSTDDYIVYVVPIKVNGKDTYLRMLYTYDTEKYSVAGLWDGMDETLGCASRNTNKLKDGDKVEFVYETVDVESGESYEYSCGGFTVNGDITIEEYELWDGTYYYGFELTDIFGNTYESDYVTIEIDGDETYISLE